MPGKPQPYPWDDTALNQQLPRTVENALARTINYSLADAATRTGLPQKACYSMPSPLPYARRGGV